MTLTIVSKYEQDSLYGRSLYIYKKLGRFVRAKALKMMG